MNRDENEFDVADKKYCGVGLGILMVCTADI